MGNFLKAMKSGATTLNLSFGGFTTISNPQYEKREIDLCGYQHPIHFLILVPKMGLFSKICNRS